MTSLNQHLRQVEAQRRNEGSSNAKVQALLKDLSPKQRAFITDRKRFKVAVTPRRSGKSYSLCAYMIAVALAKPESPILYLALTRDSAKATVWDMLLQMLDKHDISHEARPSALTIKLANGSFITLFGGDTPGARNRLRGRKFRLICVDEGAFVHGTSMDPLIFALLPSLGDYKGTLAMASSPGETMDGLFYHAYEGDMKGSWSQHHWDILDNPFFQAPATDPKYKTTGEEELHTICNLQFGGNWNHPAFLREYRGKYVQDNSKLVYPFTAVNVIPAPTPLDAEQHIIGVDFGVTSESAIVVGKFSEYSKEFQIVDSWSRKNASVDELAAEIMSRQEKYKAYHTVADTGGLGAATAQELRSRYHMSIIAADKRDKVFFQRTMAADLLSGYIKVVKGLGVLDEWAKLIRGDDGEEIKGMKNHEADAALYAWRFGYSKFLKYAAPRLTDDQIMIQQLIQSVATERAEAETDY